eukprot:7153691-Pyramimonas_sp.AAC.1
MIYEPTRQRLAWKLMERLRAASASGRIHKFGYSCYSPARSSVHRGCADAGAAARFGNSLPRAAGAVDR